MFLLLLYCNVGADLSYRQVTHVIYYCCNNAVRRVKLKVFHNNLIDGKRGKKAGGFINYWNEKAKSQFPEAWNKCDITEGS